MNLFWLKTNQPCVHASIHCSAGHFLRTSGNTEIVAALEHSSGRDTAQGEDTGWRHRLNHALLKWNRFSHVILRNRFCELQKFPSLAAEWPMIKAVGFSGHTDWREPSTALSVQRFPALFLAPIFWWALWATEICRYPAGSSLSGLHGVT